ncbi:MAG: hypothetical protein HXY18_06795, partial [Bryobacteraceae bacterium]|nr:hypothetical protein [Bryobacteraceae bacterium]
IALKAGATKQAEQTKKGTAADIVDEKSALQYSLENFLINSHNHGAGVKDFLETYGEGDAQALNEFLREQAKNREPAAGIQDGYESTVAAIKANEAILKGERIVFSKEWFAVA